MNAQHDPWLRPVLAVGSLGLFALLLAALMFNVVPQENREMVSVGLGFLTGSMIGPVFRSVFGQVDETGRELGNKAMDAVTTATGKAIPPATVPADADAQPIQEARS